MKSVLLKIREILGQVAEMYTSEWMDILTTTSDLLAGNAGIEVHYI